MRKSLLAVGLLTFSSLVFAAKSYGEKIGPDPASAHPGLVFAAIRAGGRGCTSPVSGAASPYYLVVHCLLTM